MDLLEKLEEAAQILAGTVNYTVTDRVDNILTGLNDGTAGLPCVILTATSTGEEKPLRSGNHVLTLRVLVITEANDNTLAAHRTDFSAVCAAFADDEIAATLSANLAGFHVHDFYGVRYDRIPDATDTDGNAIMASFIEIDLLCCAVDITA